MSLSRLRTRHLLVASLCLSGILALSPNIWAQDEPAAPATPAADEAPIVPNTPFPSLIALDAGDAVWTLKVSEGSLRVNGDVAVNSSNRGAIWLANGSVEAQNGNVSVVGGVSRLQKTLVRPLVASDGVVSDPLPEFGIPSPGRVVSNKALFVGSEEVGDKSLPPGIYSGGIFATGKGHITLQPGVFVIVNGDFSAIGPTIEGEGVTIVMAGNKPGSLRFSLGARLNASAPTSGKLKDLLIISRAGGDFAGDVAFASAGNSELKGIIYAPNTAFSTQYTRNVTVSKIIAKNVSVTSGNVTVTGLSAAPAPVATENAAVTEVPAG
ncbi:hypothetical protein IAD21_03471 [Abditibacteriota bacterium]|nr:hypothetical protein IAD21_03471 [Abditibacteriota bacterium]